MWIPNVDPEYGSQAWILLELDVGGSRAGECVPTLVAVPGLSECQKTSLCWVEGVQVESRMGLPGALRPSGKGPRGP